MPPFSVPEFPTSLLMARRIFHLALYAVNNLSSFRGQGPYTAPRLILNNYLLR